MLLTALKKHFTKLLDDRPLLLWFDPDGDYLLLLDDLAGAGLPLRRIQSEGQLIRLRADLLYAQASAPSIVYLPWKRDAAECDLLTPLLPLASQFTDSLSRFLGAQGVVFPNDTTTRNAIKDVLPRLAKQSIGKGTGYWGKVLSSLDAVREELLGDFEDKLLNYLALPAEMHAELKKNDIEAFFFGLLASRYGFEIENHEQPEAIARRLSAHFLLARAYASAGRPATFPFQKLIPAAHLLEKCEAFLRRWQDSSFSPVFERLSAQIEPQYSLKAWLADLPLDLALGLGATFLSLEESLWARLESEMKSLDTPADWMGFFNAHQSAFAARRTGYWAAKDKAAQWQLLGQAGDLLQDIQAFKAEIDQISDAETLVLRYAAPAGWWQIDRAYRQFREALGDATGSYHHLHRRVGRTYRDFLKDLNNRFAELLANRPHWNLACLPSQTTAWTDLVKTRKGQRIAVIFVDALRLELAQALVDRLSRDMDASDITLQPRLVTLPAVTDVGMPALLPDGDKRTVDYRADTWQVQIGNSGNLASKAERVTYLRQKYAHIQIYNEISELLNTSIDQIPASAELYVTFHTALDSIGEKAHELAMTVFSTLLKDVERAIRKFREAEIDQIHVITDHGFLLVDDVSESDKTEVKGTPALKKSDRYLVGRNLGATDQLRFPIPGGVEHLEGWFARGIGMFRTPGKYNYTHGGLSLQEVVIPCLTLLQKAGSAMLEVEMTAPTEIRGKLLKVKITAISQELLAHPRQVEIQLLKTQGIEAVITSAQQVIEVGNDLDIKVLLPENASLEIDEKVVWRLIDMVSTQVIQEQAAVNKVDFF